MALTKSILTGRVVLPTDAAPINAELVFTLSGLDSEGGDILPPGDPARCVLINGELPAGYSIWRNTEGYRGTHYIVTVMWTDMTRHGIRETIRELGKIQVGDNASYVLADLLAEGTVPAGDTFWSAITEAEYQSVLDAADRAEAAADLVEGITAGQASSESTYVYIATSGQLVFSGADAFGATLSFSSVPDVYHEGQWLSPNQFTANAALDTITFSYPVNLGDTVSVKVRNWVVGNDSSMSNYRGETIEHALDRASYAEIASPYTVKPLGWRWPLQGFLGGRAEVAKSSGIQDWTPILDTALKSGEKIHISGGTWNTRSALGADYAIYIPGDTPVDVEMSEGATIKFNASVGWFDGGLFDIRAASAVTIDRKIPLRWIGGRIDVEDLVVGGASGITVFDIYSRVGATFRDVDFWAGYNKNGGLWGNVDTFITTHNCFRTLVDNCDFVGAFDAAVYFSGNFLPEVLDGIGEFETVQNSSIRRCGNAGVFKRDHVGAQLLGNNVYECGNGYLASPADGVAGSQGEAMQVRGGTLSKIQGRPIFFSTGVGGSVSGVAIQDFGYLIDAPSTMTPVSTGNGIAAIDFRGVDGGIAHHNQIRQRIWGGGTPDANKEIIGIRTGKTATTNEPSINCQINNNIIDGVHRPILDDVECARSRYVDNVEIEAVTGTILPSAVLGTSSALLKPILDFRQTIDPASIPANSPLVVNVTAPGIVAGDWIDSWSFGVRTSSTPGLPDIDVKVLAASGVVEFILRNNSGAAVDIGNTIFSARVRKQ